MSRRQRKGRAAALKRFYHLLFSSTALLIFIGDRLTKSAVLKSLAFGESQLVIEGILRITLVGNTGAAFGLLPGGQWVFALVSAVVLAFLIVYQLVGRAHSWFTSMALGLVLGGTAGNLYDRLIFGEVIDWIDLQVWPVFNLADSAVVLGLTLLIVSLLLSPSAAPNE